VRITDPDRACRENNRNPPSSRRQEIPLPFFFFQHRRQQPWLYEGLPRPEIKQERPLHYFLEVPCAPWQRFLLYESSPGGFLWRAVLPQEFFEQIPVLMRPQKECFRAS